jgi:hypothetical protein
VPVGANSGQITVQNVNGIGTSTSYFSVTDSQAPSIPTGVTATAFSPNQININWNISTDNIGVSYYIVYRNGNQAATPSGPTNNIWQDTFVLPNSTYSYTVSACDSAGNCSLPSSSVQATTPAATPGTPTNLSVIPGDGEATVSFTAPVSNGGSAILDYTITTIPTATIKISGTGTSRTVRGLNNNQPYTIYVSATNANGPGPAANISTTPTYAPFRITSVINNNSSTVGYSSLTTALSLAEADAIIKTNAVTVTISEPPLVLSKGVTISGGFNANYSSSTDYTTITGLVNINSSGKVIFNNVKVK